MNTQSGQIAMRVMHGHEAQCGQQERQHQRQIVSIVHAANAHRNHGHRVHESKPGGQNVNATVGNRHRRCVHAMTAPGPVTDSLLECGGERHDLAWVAPVKTVLWVSGEDQCCEIH